MIIGETRLIYNRFYKLTLIVAVNRNCPRKKCEAVSPKLLKTKTPHKSVAFIGKKPGFTSVSSYRRSRRWS